MGGVDHHDWLVCKYSIAIRRKKLYWPLWTRLIDMAIVNAWLIHKAITGTNAFDLLIFRRYVATNYLKRNIDRKVIGRPITSIANTECKYDGKYHIITKRDKQQRFQNRPS